MVFRRIALGLALTVVVACEGPPVLTTEGLTFHSNDEVSTYATVTPKGHPIEYALLIWTERDSADEMILLDDLASANGHAWRKEWIFQAPPNTPNPLEGGIPGWEPAPSSDYSLEWKQVPWPWNDLKDVRLGGGPAEIVVLEDVEGSPPNNTASDRFIDYLWLVHYRDKEGGLQALSSPILTARIGTPPSPIDITPPDGDDDDEGKVWSLGPVDFTSECGAECVGYYISGTNVTHVVIEWEPADDEDGNGLDDYAGILTERYQLMIRKEGAPDCEAEYVPFTNAAENYPECWVEDRNTNLGFGINLEPDTVYHLAVRASRLDDDDQLESGQWTRCVIRTAGPPSKIQQVSPAGGAEVSAPPGATAQTVPLTWNRSACDATSYTIIVIGPNGFEEKIEVSSPGEDPPQITATSMTLPVNQTLAWGVRAQTPQGDTPLLTSDDFETFKIVPQN